MCGVLATENHEGEKQRGERWRKVVRREEETG